MTTLSPAADAVLDAVTAELDWDARYHSHTAAAAALRAVADQMAAWADEDGRIDLGDLLAIADELEDVS